VAAVAAVEEAARVGEGRGFAWGWDGGDSSSGEGGCDALRVQDGACREEGDTTEAHLGDGTSPRISAAVISPLLHFSSLRAVANPRAFP
jgi:hypothetical protein